jgi:hypothetical protein
LGFFTCGFRGVVDLVRKVVMYVVAQLKEVDVKRLMYVVYLVDRELYYLCGFTWFTWRYVFSGLRSFDVYDVADELVDLGYLDKEVKEADVVYRFVREGVEVELPKQLKDVVDKVLEKVKDVKDLEEYVLKRIDLNIVKTAST